MKYLSKEAAVEGVKKIFGNSDVNSISLDEIFVAWERQDHSPLLNLRWLGNKMTHWKYHNLIKPIYKIRNGKRVLGGIQLTLQGKQAISNTESAGLTPQEESNKHSSLLEVMKLVETLKKENPNYEITFDVKLKNRE